MARQVIFVLWAWAWTWAFFLPGMQATQVPVIYDDMNDFSPFLDLDTTVFDNQTSHYAVGRRADKVPLRILPLGASIVWGMGSSKGNGFRKPLRDQLRYEGFEVNMVGNRRNGDMKDNDVQGTPGHVITEGYAASQSTYKFFPNVVVINLGTNDANGNVQLPLAGTRMRQLITDFLDQPGMEKTIIVLSTLIPTGNAGFESRRQEVNRQYRALVQELRSNGRKIVLADMDPVSSSATGWIRHPQDMDDNIHPNDEGFKKMAYVFYRAIMRAWEAGMIQGPNRSPVIESGSAGNTCEKRAGDGVWAGGLTQRGSGEDDGIYHHYSQSMGTVLTIDSEWDRNQFRFAKLYNRKRDDLTVWWKRGDDSVRYVVWRNTGNADKIFVQIEDMDVANNCGINGVHFRDLNADGLDDFVCIGTDGAMYASINQGDGTTSKPPSFKSLGKIMDAKAGFPQDQVRLADIDGDGRCDYCVVQPNGDVSCWRNGGTGNGPEYWQALGTVFTGKRMGDLRGVRFYDLNGDGRDDWLWVSDAGQTTTWTNARSCAKEKLATWRQGFYTGQSSGPTHPGMDGFGKRDRIHFARVYDSPQDFGLLGRADYVYMEHTKNGDRHKFEVKVWKNQGYGSTKMKADGNKYCNMQGSSSGREDYIWVHSKGAMTLYPNLGRTSVSGGQQFWGPSTKDIFVPSKEAGKSLDRRDLHLFDWNNDGVCDVVWVDPDNNNRVQVWINQYPRTKTWTWTHLANPAPQLSCSQKRGVGIFDLPVRFADISGNGRPDYLCIEKDGRTSGFEQRTDGSWSAINQFKKAEGADRANLRWADVNGDGRDDMIWVDKFNGNGRVFLNVRRAEVSGSQFEWKDAGRLYAGNGAGACEYFPDFTGNGRADVHVVKGSWTNQAETWFNMCSVDATGDDPGGVVNPKLPRQPGDEPGDGGGGGGGDDGGEADYDPSEDDDKTLTPCEKKFSSLDAIFNDDNISEVCGPQYLIEMAQTILNDGLQRYDEIMKGGYDGYFNTYAGYIVSTAYDASNEFLRENGHDYFTCNVTEEHTCCSVCEALMGYDCTSCLTKEECPTPSHAWDNMIFWGHFERSCPPEYSSWGMGSDWEKTIRWKLRPNKRDEFMAEFSAATGAPEDKIKWTAIEMLPLPFQLGQSCLRQKASNGIDGMSESCYNRGFWMNRPSIEDFGKGDVTNPKDAVSQSLGKLKDLKDSLAATTWEIKAGVFDGSIFDAVDAVMLPIFTIEQSLELMEEVVKMAKDIKEAEKKSFILNMVSSILFLIPLGGQALASAGLAGFGRLLIWAGELGNIGMGAYSVASEPKSAILFIFETVMSVRSMRDASKVKSAAEARRNVPDQDIAGFSSAVALKLAEVGRISKRQGKRPVCLG